MTETLWQLAHAVADLRDERADKKAALDAARRDFEIAHAALIADVAAIGEELEEREADLRAALLACGKGKHPGGEVKEFATIAYDATDALNWATEHKVCLALDKKSFEKVAKASPLPFVVLGTELRATLASNITATL